MLVYIGYCIIHPVSVTTAHELVHHTCLQVHVDDVSYHEMQSIGKATGKAIGKAIGTAIGKALDKAIGKAILLVFEIITQTPPIPLQWRGVR